MKNARHLFVALLIFALLLVVLGAILQSTPLYLVGAIAAVILYALACISSDAHEFGR
ncbi:hypothetical protein [Kitasatospora herbaricolor]|uniref:hypothetical protein n=1 Tax=Kitasatospora herbaricolor TaxID=68217 RepID=UPI0036DE3294